MELLEYLEAEADKLHEENFSSSDEFRTVNHSFVEGFNYALAIVQGFEVKLNENQQIVLDYLKNTFVKSDNAPIVNFSSFGWKHFGAELPSEVEEAYKQMNGPQDLQVLAAFVEWGKKEVAE